MLKNQAAAAPAAQHTGLKNVRILATSALLAAISVVLARLIIPMPNETTRFSLEAVPIFIAGMLFGPIPGALVGFVADFVGCLFSGYGYNPMFCIPPILYGLSAGLFRPMLVKKVNIGRIALAFLPAIVFGSILWQSFALSFVYGKGFWLMLSTRAVQFAITMVLEVVITFFLFKSKVFNHMGVWPLADRNKEG